jgi:GNAT superfamily N-acetyltransferase
MRFAEKTRQGIAPYKPEQWPEVEAFRARWYCADSPQRTAAYFAWMFEGNPCRSDNGTRLWLSTRQGRIVGQQGSIPFDLKIGEQCRGAAWAVDLFVDPAWQLRGIGPALSAVQARSCEVAVALGVSDAAWRAYVRAGWTDLGRLERRIRPFDLGRLLRARPLENQRLDAVLRAIGPWLADADTAGWAVLHALQQTSRQMGRAAVDIVTMFDERVDALCCELQASQPVAARRNFERLRWRFDLAPHHDLYRRLYLTVRGKLRGYLVYRVNRFHGEPIAVAVDYLVASRHYTALFGCWLEFARREGAIAAFCTVLDGAADRRLWRLGFFRYHGSLAPRLLVRPGDGSGDATPMLQNRSNWFVTLADSDIDDGFIS